MKKFSYTIILATALLFVNTYAKADYVLTSVDTIMCKEVVFDKTEAKIILKNNEVKNISKDDIHAYLVNGHFYEKMPVYSNGKNSGKLAFMELLNQRNDLKLYQFEYTEGYNNNVTDKKELLVYKDGKLYLPLNEKNTESILSFFNSDPKKDSN